MPRIPTIPCLCGEKFASLDHLDHHAAERGHCNPCSCGRVFASENALNQHCRDKRDDPTRQHDPDRTGLTLSMARGLRVPPPTPPTPPASIKCKECNQKFNSQSALADHTNAVHPTPWICPTCSTAFRPTIDFKFETKGPSSLKKLFMHQARSKHCYCGEHKLAFSSDEKFKEHLESHQQARSFNSHQDSKPIPSQNVGPDRHGFSTDVLAPVSAEVADVLGEVESSRQVRTQGKGESHAPRKEESHVPRKEESHVPTKEDRHAPREDDSHAPRKDESRTSKQEEDSVVDGLGSLVAEMSRLHAHMLTMAS